MGSAQAQNLRESLAGSVKVAVGLRAGSASFPAARAAGFAEEDGTLGEMFDVITASDMVLLLISDTAQAELHERIFAALRLVPPSASRTASCSGTLPSRGRSSRLGPMSSPYAQRGWVPRCARCTYRVRRRMAPASMPASQSTTTLPGTRRTGGWSVAVGAPCTFQTTLRSEYLSDLTGERAILLAAVHGLVEALYQRYRDLGMNETAAYRHSVDCVTGPISWIIYKEGMDGLYQRLNEAGREVFGRAYAAAYPVGLELTHEVYDEVSSGNEIRSVIMAGKRLGRFSMGKIDQSGMWRAGEVARRDRDDNQLPLDPFTAGTFCGVMMAQIDTLIENGHPYSEIANKSVIEATDSLNPYMHARGVSYMVDNCSTTARLGARKWAPRFGYLLTQVAFPAIDDPAAAFDTTLVKSFEGHVIHEVLRTCAQLRPSVDIFVQ